ncbi:MAG: SlyX family protein [Spirochaetaceae bacterium]|nr:SlyX family protein [Spirochaetaceae bacterium]
MLHKLVRTYRHDLTRCGIVIILSLMLGSPDRLIAIETKLAFLEDTLVQLGDVGLSQEKRIERLEAENKALRSKYRELRESLEEPMPHTKPPHY